MICLRCFFVSPPGSLRCGGCARGLGGKVCGAGHKSPGNAVVCCSCGRTGDDLSEYAPCLMINHAARAVTWAALARAAFWLARHPYLAASDAGSACLRAGAWLFGVSPCEIVRFTVRVAVDIGFAYLLSYILPEKAGSGIRRVVTIAVVRLPGLLWRVAKAVWHVTVRLAEGSHANSKGKEGGNARQH